MHPLLEKLDIRSLRLILAGITLLMVAVLFSYVIMPEVKLLRTVQNTRLILSQVGEGGQDLAQELASMQQAVQAVRQQLHGDIANLPVRQIEAVIIGRLQKISWQNKIELISVQPGTGQRVHMFDEALFQVNLTGDYFSFYDWLKDLSTELGYVVIKQFNIKPIQSKANENQLSVELTMVSYRARQS